MAIVASNYSLYTAVNTQENLPAIGAGTSFYGTLNILNRNASDATVEVWLVPTGIGSPRNQDYIEEATVSKGKPLTISALALPAGMKVYVRSTQAVSVCLNGQTTS